MVVQNSDDDLMSLLDRRRQELDGLLGPKLRVLYLDCSFSDHNGVLWGASLTGGPEVCGNMAWNSKTWQELVRLVGEYGKAVSRT